MHYTGFSKTVLIIAITLSAGISFVCTGYFAFYALGNTAGGYFAIVAGVCIQLFGYTLIPLGLICTKTRKVIGSIAVVLGAISMACSMLASFGALYGASLTATEQQQSQAAVSAYRQKLITQLQQQADTLNQSAAQAIPEQYRTQAADHLQQGFERIQKQESIIASLENQSTVIDPYTALTRMFSDSEALLGKKMFAALFSILFDLLPVAGMLLLVTPVAIVKTPAAPAKKNKSAEDGATHRNPGVTDDAQLFHSILQAIRNKEIEPTYRAVGAFAKIGNQRVKRFFDWCAENEISLTIEG